MALGEASTEMARNVIAERVLNLPREYAANRGVPFNEVRRNLHQPSYRDEHAREVGPGTARACESGIKQRRAW